MPSPSSKIKSLNLNHGYNCCEVSVARRTFFCKSVSNRKVLRERKRHIARRVASARSVVLSPGGWGGGGVGGVTNPWPWEGGYLSPGGGYPSLDGGGGQLPQSWPGGPDHGGGGEATKNKQSKLVTYSIQSRTHFRRFSHTNTWKLSKSGWKLTSRFLCKLHLKLKVSHVFVRWVSLTRK